MPYRLILFVFFCIAFLTADAQIDINESIQDTIRVTVDSVSVKKEKKPFFLKGILKEPYPSPRKAALFSLILPGAGQAYNKKYWKIPLVYAGIGGLVYAVHINGTEFRKFRDAYKARVDGLDCTTDIYVGFASAETLRNTRDFYSKNYQLSYVGLGVVYILNGVEAFVDAHLLTFNVDEDLSMRVQPTSQILPDGNTAFGIGVSFYQTEEVPKIHPAFLGL